MSRGTLENLVQNRDYSPEQRRAWAKKAGLASGEARRRRKTSMEHMREVLSCKLDDPELVKKLKALGLDENIGAGIALAQALRAACGDTEAARFCRDTAGDKPSESMNIGLYDKPVKAMDLTQLSDAELEALADRVEESEE